MSTSVLQEVYRAIVIGKLCYTSSTSADDQQHLDGFIRHSIRQDYYASDIDIISIIDQTDLTNANHVISSLLPDKTDQHYYLRRQTTC